MIEREEKKIGRGGKDEERREWEGVKEEGKQEMKGKQGGTFHSLSKFSLSASSLSERTWKLSAV